MEAGNRSIARLQELQQEVIDINDFLKKPAATDPDTLANTLSMINAYIARTGEMLAECQYLCSLERGRILEEFLQDEKYTKLSACAQKDLMASRMAFADSVVTLVERANKAATHIADNMRSQLSASKEDMALTRKGY